VYFFVAVAEEPNAEEVSSPKLTDQVYGDVPPLAEVLNVIVEPTVADVASALKFAESGVAAGPLL
jgi:hypothetical protein